MPPGQANKRRLTTSVSEANPIEVPAHISTAPSPVDASAGLSPVDASPSLQTTDIVLLQVARGIVMRVYGLEFADALILSCAYIYGEFLRYFVSDKYDMHLKSLMFC